MTARIHHYVPQCYLSGFALQRKKARQVQVFDRNLSDSFPSSIRNVGGERDFNRIEIEGHKPDAFETGMAEFESELAPALTRLIQAQSLENAKDKNYALNLIALLALRNPSRRETIRDFHQRVTKVTLDLATATPDRWESQLAKMRAAGYVKEGMATDYEAIRKVIEEDGYRVELPNERHIIYEMDGVDAILPYLGDRRWVLVKAPPESGGFVTSDQPVTLQWIDPPGKGRRMPLGFGLKNTEVVFPLSTRLAMLGAFEVDIETDKDVFHANEIFVAEINGTTIAHSRRQVYARDLNFHYTARQGTEPKKAQKLSRDPLFHTREH
jgi:hypothetical protein